MATRAAARRDPAPSRWWSPACIATSAACRCSKGIDFTAHAGELLSLVGPNGAGKTTLMRCIADGLERSGGTVRVYGEDIGRRPPDACIALGIGRKFQTANVFDTLTVAECLRVARFRLEPPSWWRRAGVLRLPDAAVRIAAETGLAAALDVEARHLQPRQEAGLGAGDGARARAGRACCSTSRPRG